MAYRKTRWIDHVAERIRNYRHIQNQDGSVTHTPDEGQIAQQGTPLSAENLNNIEDNLQYLSIAFDELSCVTQAALRAIKAQNAVEKIAAINETLIEMADNIGNLLSNMVPKTRTVNGKALSSNITLSASDVNAVPSTRTVNGKVLTGDIALSASDVGAVSSTLVGAVNGVAPLNNESKVPPERTTSTIMNKGNSFTLDNSVNGRTILLTGNGNITITVPTSLDSSFEAEFINWSAASVNFAAAPGVTLNSVDGALELAARYSAAVMKRVSTSAQHYVLVGDLT